MLYEIVLKDEADEELAKLTSTERTLVFKQFKKIVASPELGSTLGNRAGYNLSGYRKMYADRKRIRIVYRVVEQQIVVEIVAIGKRDEMEVYKNASERV